MAWPAVLEHGLRHLAWLAKDDEAVGAALDQGWHAVLHGYIPAPFQHLGGGVDMHNMEVTRDQVLAMSAPAQDGADDERPPAG